jgi:biopolymer transport protein ExbD
LTSAFILHPSSFILSVLKFYTRRRASPVITIIPLIDILTILLIFFIVTTTFKNPQPQVMVTLPELKVVDKPGVKAPPPVLAIKPTGEVFLEDKPIELDKLGEAVKRLQEQKRPPIMRVDEKSPSGRMFEVLDALKAAGIQQVPAAAREKKP